MDFTIIVMLKITFLQQLPVHMTFDYKLILMWPSKIDAGGDGKQLIILMMA